jgi:uncharacterized protein (TIGR02611 family)
MDLLNRLRDRFHAMGLRHVWRVVVFVIGMTVLLIGFAMLVLPGPAVLVIPAGLAILGLEFHWARRWLKQARALFEKGVHRVSGRGESSTDRSRRAERSG